RTTTSPRWARLRRRTGSAPQSPPTAGCCTARPVRDITACSAAGGGGNRSLRASPRSSGGPDVSSPLLFQAGLQRLEFLSPRVELPAVGRRRGRRLGPCRRTEAEQARHRSAAEGSGEERIEGRHRLHPLLRL